MNEDSLWKSVAMEIAADAVKQYSRLLGRLAAWQTAFCLLAVFAAALLIAGWIV